MSFPDVPAEQMRSQKVSCGWVEGASKCYIISQ
jgi:hypothetical protein